MKYQIRLYMLLLSFIISCTHVNYIGRTYQPTQNIDLYFSEKEASKDYEVMGHAISAGQIFVSVEDLKEKLIEEARLNGADAIIITGIERDNEYDVRGYDAEKQIKATFIKYK